MRLKVVVDTSIVVKWLNQTNEKNIDIADKILDDALKSNIELLVPELAKYELGNVLLKGKLLTPKEAHTSLGIVYSLPINFVIESEDTAKETYQIAYSLGITYYDASFLTIAKRNEAVLITDNAKHQQKKISGLKVIALKDY